MKNFITFLIWIPVLGAFIAPLLLRIPATRKPLLNVFGSYLPKTRWHYLFYHVGFEVFVFIPIFVYFFA